MSLQSKMELLKNALTIAFKVLETVIKIVDVITEKLGDNTNAV